MISKIKILFLLIVFSEFIYSQDKEFVINSRSEIFSQNTFGQCHSSTILEIDSNQFIAAWFAGSYEGASDVSIWLSHYKDNTWGSPKKVAIGLDSLGNKVASWNPVLFSSNNKIYLFYKVGVNPREWVGKYIFSENDGNDWSEPKFLSHGFLGPIKNKPIKNSKNQFIFPSSIETKDGEWISHVEIVSKDFTEWEKISIPKDSSVGVIQPTILKYDNKKLQLLCRSNQDYIMESFSYDNGKSWSILSKTSVNNPNSGIDAISLREGGFILVYNPMLSGENWFNGRNILSVAFSVDGTNWDKIIDLEHEKDGEFSYPAVIQARDGKVHITYTYDRKTIKHVAFFPHLN